MTLIILAVGCLLGGAYANALPQITAGPQLFPRQDDGLVTLWSPTVIGTSLTYDPFTPPETNAIIVTYQSWWEFCLGAASLCDPWTTCIGGTVFDHTTSEACPTNEPYCGIEYLYTTLGAENGFTGYACFSTATIQTFFYVSPNGGAASSTTSYSSGPTISSSSPTSTTTTSSPTPTPSSKSKTPVGAIVGGVVGGLAAIAAIAALIFLLLRRRNSQDPAAGGAVGQSEVQQQPPDSPYDPKHASYMSSYPASPTPAPPPLYQTPMAQTTASYKPNPSSPNPTDPYAGHFAPSPVGSGSPAPQYGGTPMVPGQNDMGYNVMPPHGVVEMNADQTLR